MRNADLSTLIVIYNLVIGVLIMLGSEKLGTYAGAFCGGRWASAARLTRVSALTFGSAVAALSAMIYVLFHLLRLDL